MADAISTSVCMMRTRSGKSLCLQQTPTPCQNLLRQESLHRSPCSGRSHEAALLQHPAAVQAWHQAAVKRLPAACLAAAK